MSNKPPLGGRKPEYGSDVVIDVLKALGEIGRAHV